MSDVKSILLDLGDWIECVKKETQHIPLGHGLDTLESAYEEIKRLNAALDKDDDIVHALQIELAAKEEVIKVLYDDIRWYRKDRNDSMIQDQGVKEE